MNEGKHDFKEVWTRSLVKAITYRIVILILDFTATFLLTGRIEVALAFMIVSNFYTSIAYYFHERIWNRTNCGKKGRSATHHLSTERHPASYWALPRPE